jgi:hypothetical protein
MRLGYRLKAKFGLEMVGNWVSNRPQNYPFYLKGIFPRIAKIDDKNGHFCRK